MPVGTSQVLVVSTLQLCSGKQRNQISDQTYAEDLDLDTGVIIMDGQVIKKDSPTPELIDRQVSINKKIHLAGYIEFKLDFFANISFSPQMWVSFTLVMRLMLVLGSSIGLYL